MPEEVHEEVVLPFTFLTRPGFNIRQVDGELLEDGQHIREGTGLVRRIVGDESGHDALHAAEADGQIPGEVALHFEEIALVDQPSDDVMHREGRLGILGHELV